MKGLRSREDIRAALLDFFLSARARYRDPIFLVHCICMHACVCTYAYVCMRACAALHIRFVSHWYTERREAENCRHDAIKRITILSAGQRCWTLRERRCTIHNADLYRVRWANWKVKCESKWMKLRAGMWKAADRWSLVRARARVCTIFYPIFMSSSADKISADGTAWKNLSRHLDLMKMFLISCLVFLFLRNEYEQSD